VGVWCLVFGTSTAVLAGEIPCPGNLDEDAIVGAFDLALLLGAWGQCPDPCSPGDPDATCAADFNGDCTVGAFDLAFVLGAWGPCPGPPVNDLCEGAIEIFDGDTDFDTTYANTGGPTHPGCGFVLGLPRQDVWFTYTASCTGLLQVCTCNQAFWDTNLVLYEGCDCPASDEQFLACNEDWEGCLLFTSRMLAAVEAGACYKIRLGGFLDTPDDIDEGPVTLTLSCVEGQNSNCCFPHPGTGCDDQACEDFICGIDPWCCEFDWDDTCIIEAHTFCDGDHGDAGSACEGVGGC